MSRLILSFFSLTQKEGQDLCLKIPICEVYGPIIDRAFPDLNHIGWRESTKGTCYTFLKDISEEEQERLEQFLELLHRIYCLTLTKHLAPYFTTELDEAYALDFNFKQAIEPQEYTEVGELEHGAKERQDREAISKLSAALAEAIGSHPTLGRADIIVGMPPRPSKDFHLASEVVREAGSILVRDVGLALTKDDIPKLRQLPIHQKLKALDGAFHLTESVEGKTVLIIDDLYQSGTSVWSLAKFLKDNSAREVYALACVKSWRDTDNQ